MPNLGGWEWVILAVVALILFGGTKISGFGKNAGKAIREFKEESQIQSKKDQAQPQAKTEQAPQASAPEIHDAELVDPERKPDA